MLQCTKLCGRTGVRWFAAHDRLTTLRDSILVLTALPDWIRRRCPLSLRFGRGGRDSRMMLHRMKRCGRTGMRWFAAHDRLTTPRDSILVLTALPDWIRRRCPLSLRFGRGGRDSRMMLHRMKRCGRTGMRWFAARDRLTTPRDSILVLTALPDWIRRRCPLSLRFGRGGRDSRMMLHCTKRCGRAGAAVRWFAARDRLTTPRD